MSARGAPAAWYPQAHWHCGRSDALLHPQVRAASDFPLGSLGPQPERQWGAVGLWGWGLNTPWCLRTHVLGVTCPAGDFPRRGVTTIDLSREGLEEEQETLLA